MGAGWPGVSVPTALEPAEDGPSSPVAAVTSGLPSSSRVGNAPSVDVPYRGRVCALLGN